MRLGELIEETDARNSFNKLRLSSLKGISIEKKFIETKANMDGVSLLSYKLVKPLWLTYVPVTSRNGGKISLAFNDTNETFIVSSAYTIFKSKDENRLNSEYLYLIFKSAEFDRWARFNSWGSARETLVFADLAQLEIPLPGIEEQRAIAALYRCGKEAQRIANETQKVLNNLCPALVQWTSNQPQTDK